MCSVRGVETGSALGTTQLQKIVVTHSELERIRREASSGFASGPHGEQSCSIDTMKGGNRIAEERSVWPSASASASATASSASIKSSP